jgi:cation:H+ antiporter
VAGTYLSRYGDVIAEKTGWGGKWIGLGLLATVTSLPELITGISAVTLARTPDIAEVVVTVAALRIGALDMAISNLFGSNLFDILIVAIDDILYLPGPILSDVSSVHAVTAMSAIMMTGVTVIGQLYRPRARVLKLVGWTSLLLLCLYLLNTFVLYLHGTA